MIYIEKKVISRKCVDVCVSVRVFAYVVNFLSCDNSKEVAPIALEFIDFSGDLSKIVGFRKYRRFCLICPKFLFIWIYQDQMWNKDLNQL